MHALLRLGNPVLLYHATFRAVPADLAAAVHNVAPAWLGAHLEELRRSVRFVSIDEFVAARNRRGLAAVTFDDAYRCVLAEAAPILLGLDIPFTVFVNGASLERKTFWRDKVRAILGLGLAQDCAQSFRRTRAFPGLSFYEYTKDPRNDSAAVEEELDAFLASRGIPTVAGGHTLDEPRSFLVHPLISYGNHSHHHYVLSSLRREQQYEEVTRTDALLDAIPGIGRSRVFSIPFGEPRHFDAVTLELLADLGYRGALLSRERLNLRPRTRAGLPLIERFMPTERPLGTRLARLALSL